jgi:hypothetical protein
MKRTGGCLVCLGTLLVLVAGCSSGEQKKAQLSGKVLFNGKPVPAGFISFMPNSSKGNTGAATVAAIKDGLYDTARSPQSGIKPGPNVITIQGFDGKPLPNFPNGKQIFNPFERREDLAEGTKDFSVPASAAENLKIEPTTDTGP